MQIGTDSFAAAEFDKLILMFGEPMGMPYNTN